MFLGVNDQELDQKHELANHEGEFLLKDIKITKIFSQQMSGSFSFYVPIQDPLDLALKGG